MTTSWQIPLWYSVPALPPFPIKFGKGSGEDPARARSQNEAGSLNPSRRARLFDLVWLAVPSPEVTSHSGEDFLPRTLGRYGLGFFAGAGAVVFFLVVSPPLRLSS